MWIANIQFNIRHQSGFVGNKVYIYIYFFASATFIDRFRHIYFSLSLSISSRMWDFVRATYDAADGYTRRPTAGHRAQVRHIWNLIYKELAVGHQRDICALAYWFGARVWTTAAEV